MGNLAHNLKAVGSNPTPATKSCNNIKGFNPERNAGDISQRVYINATSTSRPNFDVRQHQTTITNIRRHKSPLAGAFGVCRLRSLFGDERQKNGARLNGTSKEIPGGKALQEVGRLGEIQPSH